MAARLPLMVGAVPELDEASATSETSGDTQIAATDATGHATAMEDVGYACPADNGVPCFFEDVQTGLFFGLPPGWITDFPTREAATAGGQPGPVRVSFFSTTEPVETVTLNPHQWTTMNGPCIDIQPGVLCRFDSDSAEMARAMEILSRAIRDMGPPSDAGAAPAVASTDGHGEDVGAARAWSDYPYRCLPDDKTNPTCEMQDASTGLHFLLPDKWVADVSVTPEGPRADFFEVTADARSAQLTPVERPSGGTGCFYSRAGDVCTDMALMDETLARSTPTIRRYLRTGEVLRNCADVTCDYALPAQGFSGTLPNKWGVEIPRTQSDGTISTWFYSFTPDLDLKLVGLNQPGGDNCIEAAPGLTLCEFTPYISTSEMETIARTLRLGPPSAPGTQGLTGRQVDRESFDRALSILQGNQP